MCIPTDSGGLAVMRLGTLGAAVMGLMLRRSMPISGRNARLVPLHPKSNRISAPSLTENRKNDHSDGVKVV